MSRYIIITPAHNEEAFIENTIRSMVRQSVQPVKWIVVNDSSTDRTSEIVTRYAPHHPIMKLVNVERARGRHFANKVLAFNRGLAEARDMPHDYIGNLDADISLEQSYYGNILREFERDSKLGIAGGQVFMKMRDKFVTR